ncbi:MAG TPA: hypothetical protein VN697_15245, partial [Tepidiformaceae bacterium]|nr:hypothetical protein [Tepidiformaceae bacterium]
LVSEISDTWRPFLVHVAEELGNDLDSVTLALERIAAAAARVRAVEPPLPEPESADGAPA